VENSEVAEIINISDSENDAVSTGSCSVNTDDNITNYGNDSSLSTKDANPEPFSEQLRRNCDTWSTSLLQFTGFSVETNRNLRHLD